MLRPKLFACLIALLSAAAGCSAGGSKGSTADRVTSQGTGGGSSNLNVGGATGAGAMGTTLNVSDAGPMSDTDAGDGSNPQTCDAAAAYGSYVGCDFWPTIVANPVWTEFAPAVVIANGSMTDAQITVDGPSGYHEMATVPAGGLQTVMLEWVPDLKGPEFSVVNTSGGRLTSSVRVNGGAYHMTSSVPVTAWQFNPLDYTHPAGGACPPGDTTGCLSASVDASLLLPSTAMTKNYRIFAYSSKNEGMDWGSVPGGAAITATQDNTMVTVQLGPNCGTEIYPTTMLGTCVAAGNGVDAKNANDIFTLAMNAGDVVELVGAWAADPQTKNADLSGSVVNATAPVQVVSFNAIAQLPDYSVANADHMEETVLPAEVLGNKYIVVPPTTPNGNAVGHVVRLYGNVDGTHLTYSGTKPVGAPDIINAGDMVQIPPLPTGQPAPDCLSTAGNCMVPDPFIVEGDQPFAVASFMVGGTLQMPGTDAMNSQGDPSMSMEVTPQQFRKQYTFLAPKDYLENFADVLIPTGADVTLDGNPLSGTPTPIDADWGYVRAKLDNSGTGVHSISTTNANGLGLQVMGFGFATSYYYPGGLNLIHISPPPVIPVVK
ncbi:MAG TPA: IgGFc-binding protein [Polyangiaceae bacterium]|nr:IgGFc-binding protein [Polyangiaceae bacterium]